MVQKLGRRHSIAQLAAFGHSQLQKQMEAIEIHTLTYLPILPFWWLLWVDGILWLPRVSVTTGISQAHLQHNLYPWALGSYGQLWHANLLLWRWQAGGLRSHLTNMTTVSINLLFFSNVSFLTSLNYLGSFWMFLVTPVGMNLASYIELKIDNCRVSCMITACHVGTWPHCRVAMLHCNSFI